MKTRILGTTDLELTVIGLGTWAIGGGDWAFGWGSQDDNESVKTIHEALEGGVNWIDTAPVYGYGRSEEVVGRALKEWGQPVTVATKFGRLPNPDGNPNRCIKRESVIIECEDSLRRLGVETIDLYQMHWPQPEEDIEEAFQAMLDLKEQGKIRWAGASNFNAAQLDQISKLGPVASLQSPYSLLNRGIEENELPWCATNKCGVVGYSPMQCGLLTGKVTKEWIEDLPEDDWRKTKNPFFQDPAVSKHIKTVERLQGVAQATGHTVGQLAVAWTLHRPELTAAIVGARHSRQISDILPAGDWTLDQETLEAVEAVCV